jgi:hypothetical protein
LSFITSPYEGTQAPTTNGHVAEPVEPVRPLGPRIPRRELWLELPGEYGQAGMQVKVWVNYPRPVLNKLMSSDDKLTKEALLQIVLEHNGWTDFEGEPFPAANDPGEVCTVEHPEGEACPGMLRDGFWEAIPDELAAAVIVLVRLESGKLATSLIPARRQR